MARPRAAGVYVHVPYCRRRCPYCDFYFEIGASTAGFVAAIERELARRSHTLTWPASTLSFGGGTPSQLPVADLGAIILAVRRFGLTDDAEVALEVNPEDIDAGVAAGLAEAGFTRVSVGLQSFNDDVLRWLGRAHDGDRGRAAVSALVAAGLDVGVDLIVGVPGEGLARVDDDVRSAADLGVVHLSTYVLTVEPSTPLVQLIKRGARADVDDDSQADAYERVVDRAAHHGFAQYEISSHARADCASRHNRLYWQRGDYLGLGPGAHSFFVDDNGDARRRHTTDRLAGWLEAINADTDANHDDEVLHGRHALGEAVAFGLRDLGVGVDLADLADLHHTTVDAALVAALERAMSRGEVMHREGRYLLTTVGARFADRVARDVLSAP